MREQLVKASQRDYSLASWLLRTRHASRESSCQVGQCSVTSPNDALLLPPCCAYNSFRTLQLAVPASACVAVRFRALPRLLGYLLQV